jgi:hypothetical protein
MDIGKKPERLEFERMTGRAKPKAGNKVIICLHKSLLLSSPGSIYAMRLRESKQGPHPIKMIGRMQGQRFSEQRFGRH